MPAATRSAFSRLATWFSLQRLPLKIFLFAIPAVSFAAFIGLMSGAGEEPWVLIADGKDPALTEQIRQKLTQKGIAVQNAAGALKVRRQDQSRAVMSLAGEGVLGDAELFKFLEDANFTSTHWQMDKRWQVALQRKLERMIREIDSIQDAFVQITPAGEARTLGVRDAEGGKASVVVTLKPGRTELAPSEIQGIAHLVSAGVKGLSPEGVKIMDRFGHLYRLAAEDAKWSNVSDRHSLERRYEKDIEDKAHRVMASIYPQATVSAFVKLSSRRIVQRETQVAPEGATKVVEEASMNSGSGMKGLRSLALPELPPVEGAAHETRRQVEIEPGEIEHASMAIAIPTEQVPANFSAEEDRIRRLIQNATGIEDADISVQVIPVSSHVKGQDDPLPAAAPLPAADTIPTLPVALGAAVTLLALLALAGRRSGRADSFAPVRAVVREIAARSPQQMKLRLESLAPRRAALILYLLDAETSCGVLGGLDKSVFVEFVRLAQEPPPPGEVREAVADLARS
jgi:flagellar biosynthesis/type III secretory pathway M-ring protein FliF/YscJ